MKRLYLCAMVVLLSFLLLPDYARAQVETLHGKTLGGKVFEDSNQNGLNDHERGIGGITVNLHQCPNGPTLESTTTNYDDGSYSFTCSSNWDPNASYYIEFVLNDKTKTFTACSQGTDDKDSDADPATGKTECYSFQNNEKSIDAGLISTDFIGGVVWFDSDENGFRNESTPGIERIIVQLYSYAPDNQKYYLRSTETDSKGNFKFQHMENGLYCIRFVIPDDLKNKYEFTTMYQGSIFDQNYSDAGPEGWTKAFTFNLENMPLRFIDAGLKNLTYHQTGSIGNFVWLDKDGDGLQEPGEPGIQGVTVELFSCQWNHTSHLPIGSTSTDENGFYNFTGLNPGTYCLKFHINNNYQFTVMTGNLNDADNSDAEADGSTKSITLADGFMNNRCIDAGLRLNPPPQTGCVGGLVWTDNNGDGFQNEHNAGMEGILVELHSYESEYNKPLKKWTTTGYNGNYSFEGLSAGTYCVKFMIPEAMKSQYEFTLKSGQISDPGNSDAGMDGWTTFFVLADGYMSNKYIDAGLKKKSPPATGCIGDFVWFDTNGNGLQDPGEPGIKNAKVELFLCELNHSQHSYKGYTFTDNNGYYSFIGLQAGTYCLKFYTVDDYQFTVMVGSLNDANNSDAEPDGSTKPVDLYDNHMTNRNIDAGMKPKTPPPTGCIGDLVWFDSNGNGLQDQGEPGIKGVRVELYTCQWDHSSHVLQGYTTTDDHGYYIFTGLKSGTYCVKFCAFDGYKFTIMTGSLNDWNNSDADYDGWAKAITLADGYMQNKNIDAGMVLKEIKKASLGDLVWRDKDEDGIQDDGLNEPGLPNVMVELYASGSNTLIQTDITDSKGKYLFENLTPGRYYVKFILPEGFKFTKMDRDGDNFDSDADPVTGKTTDINLGSGDYNMSVDAGMYGNDCLPARIGDYVWNDLNINGIQNSNEPGLANVTVNLFRCGQSTVLASTRTDANGFYQFVGLLPGNYYLQFVLPNEFAFTYLHQGSNNALDSDAGMTNGVTDGIELSSGEVETTVDAGMFKGQCLLATLGDLVWNDNNRNGILDPGETGKEGVVLKLHRCTGSHQNPNDPCQYGPEIASRTTDKDGRYYFNNIMPGYYYVELVAPCNFTITKPDQTDDWKDSDINPSTRHTACIKLNPGETNLTVDAGLYPTPPATLGDLVWIDTNKNGIQDLGEKGLCNVTVELYMCGVGSPVATAKTDNDGRYIFKNVVSNTSYALKFYLPKGYSFTTLDQGGNDNFDSDVCPKTCGGMTKFYDVLPDEVNMSIDCGMYLATTSTCNYVWIDNNNNGLKDNGEAGIQGVTVELYNCSNNALVQSSKTDATGLFSFNDILLDSYYLKVIVPDGYIVGPSAQKGSGEGVSSDFITNGQSSCFEVTDTTKSIGSPIALVLKPTTGVAYRSGTPTEFSLMQNYPNPFNPSTTIEFAVPAAGQYTLKVFNTLGQEVATLLNSELPVGYHSVMFDASGLTSGMYIYRLSGNNIVIIKKMMLSK
ncbi:MAG: SdrD B-like domain-containing protein [Acidobacteriota bacterium]